MRLINARTYELQEFNPGDIPKYAILSHTWGVEEVLYEDLRYASKSCQCRSVSGSDDKGYQDKVGWKKIEYTCRQALKDELGCAWVDTCCIDKSSSAELSEAINSMFSWYQRADRCYAYLSDVSESSNSGLPPPNLGSSRWFSRGWTLQELLAPAHVIFWSSAWECLGTKVELKDILSDCTRIDRNVLTGVKPLASICVAQKMSWAAMRQTTRPEDMAYCLLGIFGIHLPPLYGENEKAFLRLQEEILKTSDDHSLFAWTDRNASGSVPYGILARHPVCFTDCNTAVSFRDWTDVSPATTSNLGVSVTLRVQDMNQGYYEATLNCVWSESDIGANRACLVLKRVPGAINQYQRVLVNEQQSIAKTTAEKMQIYIRQDPIIPSVLDIVPSSRCRLHVEGGTLNLEVTAYLHTYQAVKSYDWYEQLLEQNPTGPCGDFTAKFHIPGIPQELSAVICVRVKARVSFASLREENIMILFGSGTAPDHRPAVAIIESGHGHRFDSQEIESVIARGRNVRGDRSGRSQAVRSECKDIFQALDRAYRISANFPPYTKVLSDHYKIIDRHVSISGTHTLEKNSTRYWIEIRFGPAGSVLGSAGSV